MTLSEILVRFDQIFTPSTLNRKLDLPAEPLQYKVSCHLSMNQSINPNSLVPKTSNVWIGNTLISICTKQGWDFIHYDPWHISIYRAQRTLLLFLLFLPRKEDKSTTRFFL